VRPYLEIQKIRMEERLDSRIDVAQGLLSAELPPMMLQTLVENAIKHGIEPQPEGGRLQVSAEVRDGQLEIVVSDTGVGLNAERGAAPGAAPGAASATGTGLQNIRERLQLHYGAQAQLELLPQPQGGALARLRLPYRVAQTVARQQPDLNEGSAA
jgi:sensor histidine kinase YesM